MSSKDPTLESETNTKAPKSSNDINSLVAVAQRSLTLGANDIPCMRKSDTTRPTFHISHDRLDTKVPSLAPDRDCFPSRHSTATSPSSSRLQTPDVATSTSLPQSHSTSRLNSASRARSGTCPSRLMGLHIDAHSAHDLTTPQETDLTTLIPAESANKLLDTDVEFLLELGMGAGGTVSKVRHTPTGRIMCRKNIILRKNDQQNRAKAEHQLQLELQILSICRSDYIVESYGAFLHDSGVSVCLEFMDCGSFDGICRHVYGTAGASIPESVGARVAIQVLKGLEYLAGLSVFHRDVKPSNVLLNTRGQVKMADFGIAKQLADTTRFSTTGTQAYLPLERIEQGSLYSVVSDVWALGITVIELVTNKNIFMSMDPIEMMTYLQECDPPKLSAIGEASFSAEFEAFISNMLVKDYKQRPHPTELLRLDYCQRILSDSVLLSEWAAGLYITGRPVSAGHETNVGTPGPTHVANDFSQ
ncbi:kinase-like domain-containing protein, partial [Chytriomyces sp. MP71]